MQEFSNACTANEDNPMAVEEPSSLEVFITVALGDLAGGLFKEYNDRLPLKGSERILELGPSAGNSTRPLAQRLLSGGGCVTAVDISAKWVAVARKWLRKLPNVEILLGEPLRFISEQEIRQLGRECGLVETSSAVREVKTQEQTFEGVFQKKG